MRVRQSEAITTGLFRVYTYAEGNKKEENVDGGGGVENRNL